LFKTNVQTLAVHLNIQFPKSAFWNSKFGPQQEFILVYQYIASPQKQEILVPFSSANHYICFYFKPLCCVNPTKWHKGPKIKMCSFTLCLVSVLTFSF